MKPLLSLLLLCFIMSTSSFVVRAQNSVTASDIVLWYAPDILYWNQKAYLLVPLPLSAFPNAATLYPDIPGAEIDAIYGTPLCFRGKSNYLTIWKLVDQHLYLSTPSLYTISGMIYKSNRWVPKVPIRDSTIYAPMERLVGVPFSDHRTDLLTEPYMQLLHIAHHVLPNSPFGVIAADWVNGTFYIKKVTN